MHVWKVARRWARLLLPFKANVCERRDTSAMGHVRLAHGPYPQTIEFFPFFRYSNTHKDS